MNILILGKSRHGKDEVAAVLKELYGLSYSSSSLIALDAIWPCLEHIQGNSTKEVAFANRNNSDNPLLWKKLVTLYNTPDKTALCKKLLEKNSVYVGMRCHEEFEACKHLFGLIIWVDASKRVKDIRANSMSIKFSREDMIFIDNNGTKECLNPQISILGKFL